MLEKIKSGIEAGRIRAALPKADVIPEVELPPLTPKEIEAFRRRLSDARGVLTGFLFQDRQKIEMVIDMWSKLLPIIGPRKIEGIRRSSSVTIQDQKLGELKLELLVGVNFMGDVADDLLRTYCYIPEKGGIKRMTPDVDAMVREVERQSVWVYVSSSEAVGSESVSLPPLKVIDRLSEIGNLRVGIHNSPRGYVETVQSSLDYAGGVFELLRTASG